MAMPKTAKTAVRTGKGRVHSRTITCGDSSSIPLGIVIEERFRLERDAAEIRHCIKGLFPAEEDARRSLEKKLDDIEHLIKATLPRVHNYPIFSQEPLTWRDKDGYPRLVVVTLDGDGSVVISAKNNAHEEGNAKWYYTPSNNALSEVIGRNYCDVGRILRRKCPRNGEFSIEMKLGQLIIPTETKQKIAAARTFFGDNIFMVVEATEWVENEVCYPDPDPLIVGCEDGHLFLIDAFDLTRVEEMAAREFTVPQPG